MRAPTLPAPLDRPVQAGFHALARLRRAPAFHPTGRAFDGEVDLDGEGPLPEGHWPALIRLSKGVGIPGGVADFLGVAVRVQHPDTVVDFLCTTTVGTRGWRRLALAPTGSWGRATLSSLMPWERAGERLWACLEINDARIDSGDPDAVAEALPLRITVRVMDSRNAIVQKGRITLTATTDPGSLAFDPDQHAPPGWQLGPRWLARLRETAYVGSRRGRRARDRTIEDGPTDSTGPDASDPSPSATDA